MKQIRKLVKLVIMQNETAKIFQEAEKTFRNPLIFVKKENLTIKNYD